MANDPRRPHHRRFRPQRRRGHSGRSQDIPSAGVYGAAVITLITVQNTTRCRALRRSIRRWCQHRSTPSSKIFLRERPKPGHWEAPAVVEAVAGRGDSHCPLVVDPVMIGKHGAPLVDIDAACGIAAICCLPKAALVTPNLHEAAELAGIAVSNADQMRQAALRIAELGPRSVLIKGGHLERRRGGYSVSRRRLHRIPRPARRYPSHARNRLHVLGGHHGVSGARAADSGCRRARQTVHRQGDPDQTRTGRRLGPGEPLGGRFAIIAFPRQ